jgi:hypothetical protein
MANIGTATVTATTGPGLTATAQVLTGIKAFFVDIEKQMLFFYKDNDDQTGPMRQFALGNTMTLTATISAGAWTITVVVS